MDALLAKMRTDLDDAHAKATIITQRAADEHRDLNDQEQANFDAYKTTIEALQPRIEDLAETQRSFDASSTALASVTGTGRQELLVREQPDFMAKTYRNAGEWIVDYLVSRAPGGSANDPGPEARAAARDRITRAVANQTVADNPGLVPDTIAGGVINYQDTRRALWNSLAQRQITAGPVFNRPRVTQHTLVGKQTAEKTELASRKMIVERVPVTVETYGGVVDVSLQDQYWSNPDIMQVIVDDLRGQYLLQTEAAAGTCVNTAAQVNKITVAATTPTSGGIIAGIYDAAASVFAGLGVLPDYVAMSIDIWADVGSLTDSAGRPIFPTLGPSNAPGQMNATSFGGPVVGLTPVVSGGLPAGSLIVYRSDAIEAWERTIGVLQVSEPRLLGTEVAYAGMAACLSLHAKSAVAVDITP